MSRRQKKSNSFKRTAAAAKYYSYGSQAEVIEEAKDLVSLKHYGRQEKAKEKKNRFNSFKKIICASIICFCSISMVFARSLVYNYQYENKQLQKVLEEKTYKTESILAQSMEKIDIAYVEEIATTRLNMAKPQPYQIEYIDVPKTDYTVNHSVSLITEKEKYSIKSALMQIFNSQDTTDKESEDDGAADVVDDGVADGEEDGGEEVEN